MKIWISRRYFLFICIGFFVFAASVYLFVAFSIGKNVEHDTKVKSDVILVLGARAYIGGAYNLCMVSRVRHAAELYRARYAPKILVSGGVDKEDRVNEAETMKKVAVEMGVSPKDILVEKKSTSTYENFLFSREILEKKHLKSVLVVTEPFHAPRAGLVAKKMGIPFTISPAADSPCWEKGKYFSRYFLKEPAAVAAYWEAGAILI